MFMFLHYRTLHTSFIFTVTTFILLFSFLVATISLINVKQIVIKYKQSINSFIIYKHSTVSVFIIKVERYDRLNTLLFSNATILGLNIKKIKINLSQCFHINFN